MVVGQPAFHTVKELKALLRIGEVQAYKTVSSGQVKAIKVGGSWRIPHSEFERLQGCEAAEPQILAETITDLRTEATAEQRFYSRVARLYPFGAHPMAELLREIAAATMQGTLIETMIERYSTRLEQIDPAVLAAIGASQMPSAPLHAVPGADRYAAT